MAGRHHIAGEFRLLAGRVDAEQWGSNQWHTDEFRDSFVHGESNGFEFTSAECDEEFEHRGGSRSNAVTDHDDVFAGWSGKFGVFDDSGGEWRHNALHLVHRVRVVASGSFAGSFHRADSRHTDDNRDFLVHDFRKRLKRRAAECNDGVVDLRVCHGDRDIYYFLPDSK